MKLTVPLADCVTALKKNLDSHISELDTANRVWVEKTKEALTFLVEAVDRRGVQASYDNLANLFLQKPIDNRALYSKYLGLMELAMKAGGTTTEMDENTYDQIFNDNWQWRIASKMSNASYLSMERE